MGQLFYGTDHQPLHMDDRLLNYLQVVIATKMRRGESFTMTWTPAAGADTGRVTLWLQSAIQMRFSYDTVEPHRLNPLYLKFLANQANSSGGVMLSATHWEEQERAHGEMATKR